MYKHTHNRNHPHPHEDARTFVLPPAFRSWHALALYATSRAKRCAATATSHALREEAEKAAYRITRAVVSDPMRKYLRARAWTDVRSCTKVVERRAVGGASVCVLQA